MIEAKAMTPVKLAPTISLNYQGANCKKGGNK
jgi:hypothetical protein